MTKASLSHIFSLSIPATEIRCQEKSRGGLRYEVIMAEPNLVKSQAPTTVDKKKSPPSKKELSAHDIEEKLKAAEQRRLVCNEKSRWKKSILFDY